MGMRRLILILFVYVVSGGCSKGGGGTDDTTTAPSLKSMWSIWTNTSTAATFDMRGGYFNAPFWMYITTVSNVCQCTFEADGGNTAGTYSLTLCGAGNGSSNASLCQALNQTGTYSQDTDSVLKMCTSGSGCNTYN